MQAQPPNDYSITTGTHRSNASVARYSDLHAHPWCSAAAFLLGAATCLCELHVVAILVEEDGMMMMKKKHTEKQPGITQV
jgi:hypothetical protein